MQGVEGTKRTNLELESIGLGNNRQSGRLVTVLFQSVGYSLYILMIIIFSPPPRLKQSRFGVRCVICDDYLLMRCDRSCFGRRRPADIAYYRSALITW